MAASQKISKYTSVKEYLDKQPDETRQTLLQLKAIILETVPGAEELINYDIPAYALVKGGKRDKQVMIAGYKKFAGFYVGTNILNHFTKELKDYETGKASVQFSNNKTLPKALIKKIIEYKISTIRS